MWPPDGSIILRSTSAENSSTLQGSFHFRMSLHLALSTQHILLLPMVPWQRFGKLLILCILQKSMQPSQGLILDLPFPPTHFATLLPSIIPTSCNQIS